MSLTRYFIIVLLLFTAMAGRANSDQKEVIQSLSGPRNELAGDYWQLFTGKTYQEVIEGNYEGGKPTSVPGSWGEVNGNELGFGTYISKIYLPNAHKELLGIKMLQTGTNYELYINRKLITKTGVFGKTREWSKADIDLNVFPFYSQSDTLEIAISISNFHYRQGGLWYAPILGNYQLIKIDYTSEWLISAMVSGALMILFFFFLGYYYTKTNDKTSLYFALVCLFSSLRIASTNGVILKQIYPAFPWEVLTRIEFFSLAFIVLFGLLYFYSLFPKDVNQKVINILIKTFSVVGVVYIFTPVFYASYTIPYLLIIYFLTLLYLLNLIIKVLFQKRQFAYMASGGFLIVILAGANDILHSQGFIHTLYLLPLAVLAFSILQAWVITRKFSVAFSEINILSAELQHINANQQLIIEERTSLLNKQTQELQRANGVKDKVFSIIAHDLRAPIKSLGTVLSWVVEDDLSYDEFKKSVSGISKNVDSLNLTLENLLHWSRAQVNGIKAQPEPIDIRKPVQDMAELYKFQFQEKGIIFKNQILEMFAVQFDKHQLNLILRNLISNAIKFTNVGGTIEVKAVNNDAIFVRVEVKDSGIGMDQESIEKAFSTTEHYSTFGTGNEKGTGLGLLLCKEYVESGGGKIWIQSAPNKGTSVFFELPKEF